MVTFIKLFQYQESAMKVMLSHPSFVHVLCTEPLSHSIRECEEISGIVDKVTEVAILHCADVTTLYLDEDKTCLE